MARSGEGLSALSFSCARIPPASNLFPHLLPDSHSAAGKVSFTLTSVASRAVVTQPHRRRRHKSISDVKKEAQSSTVESSVQPFPCIKLSLPSSNVSLVNLALRSVRTGAPSVQQSGPALANVACGLFVFHDVIFPGTSFAVVGPEVGTSTIDGILDLFAAEPKNALSFPTWVIHVASVVEWVTAMILVWEYGHTRSHSAWKGLSWGMVPLLGGAMCACTWHFFYNPESLEILVVLQAFSTFVGNCTLWIAAINILKSSDKQSSS